MPEELHLYYYATDNTIQTFNTLVPNVNGVTQPSYYTYNTIQLYDDNFEKAGNLARVIPDIYVNNIGTFFGQYYQNFILNDGSITVVFNDTYDGSSLFKAGVKIPFTYLYGSGRYFNKKITGYLLPYDNKVESRVYVFNIE